LLRRRNSRVRAAARWRAALCRLLTRPRPGAVGAGSFAEGRAAHSDSGFSLLEVIMSIAIIGIVTAAATSVFATGMKASNQMRRTQEATRLADDALELVRSYSSYYLLTGRDLHSTTDQWNNVGLTNPKIAPFLNGSSMVSDAAAVLDHGLACSVIPSGDNSNYCLPTVPTQTTVDGTQFSTSIFVGGCWQKIWATTPPTTASTDCLSTAAGGVGMPLFRVIAAVQWSGSMCPTVTGGSAAYGGCTVVATSLQSPSLAEPQFDPSNGANNALSPKVNVPANQDTTVGSLVVLPVTFSGGVGRYTFTAQNLPPGLSIDAHTGQITGTPTAAGTVSGITVTATDSAGQTVTSSPFQWKVELPPFIGAPTNQASDVGRADSYTLTGAQGTQPYNWSAIGLPAGLAITDPAAGTISGTPTVLGASVVTVTLTDASGVTAPAATFTWTVNSTPLSINPGAQSSEVGVADSLTLSGTGGTGALTWTATGLPGGLTLNPATGVISGQPTSAGTSTVTVTATDGAGVAAPGQTFTWVVVAAPAITPPGNQLSDLTFPDTLTLARTGGTGPFTWSATGLPAGLVLDPLTGIVAGTPLTAGTSSTQLTLTDALGGTASASFSWVVSSALTLSNPGNQTSPHNTTITPLAITASGGTSGYTWSFTGLPANLVGAPSAANSSGAGTISGSGRSPGVYSVRISVTDQAGATVSRTITWTVS
jgi:prepilin-type N-terminal cleavage/methylation domain-containing protein